MYYSVVLAFAAGLCLPLQALINARTGHILGNPFWATLVNFSGGTIMLILILAAMGIQLPTLDQVGRVPIYGWFSGVFGVVVVTQAAYTTPKIGVAAMIALVVTGQMLASIAYDHFGVLQTVRPVSWEKFLGVILLLSGVFLIMRPDR